VDCEGRGDRKWRADGWGRHGCGAETQRPFREGRRLGERGRLSPLVVVVGATALACGNKLSSGARARGPPDSRGGRTRSRRDGLVVVVDRTGGGGGCSG
jgi:hypothetical protein